MQKRAPPIFEKHIFTGLASECALTTPSLPPNLDYVLRSYSRNSERSATIARRFHASCLEDADGLIEAAAYIKDIKPSRCLLYLHFNSIPMCLNMAYISGITCCITASFLTCTTFWSSLELLRAVHIVTRSVFYQRRQELHYSGNSESHGVKSTPTHIRTVCT